MKNQSFASFFVVALFFILSLGGFVDLSIYNVLYPNIVFEIFIFLAVILYFRFDASEFLDSFIVLCVLFYLSWQALGFYYSGSTNEEKIHDFLIIHKVFIYILILMFIRPSLFLSNKVILDVYRIVAFSIFAKYFLSHALGIDDRPGLYTENNFELIFLLFLFIAKGYVKNNSSVLELAFLFFIVLMSGSRSGILSFAVLLFFLDWRSFGVGRLFKFVSVSTVFLVSGWVFYQRLGVMSVEEIDRFRFLLVFLNEVDKWSVFEWLVGAASITPLSDAATAELSYYQRLFSDYDTGLAYSVLLHSFLLRLVFDHGLIGLFFVFSAIYRLLARCNVKTMDIFAVLAILILNAASVSSVNSVYSSLGLIFLMGAAFNARESK